MNFYLFLIKSIFTLQAFNFLNIRSEDCPPEYPEPESFRPMILSDEEANYYFITEASLEQKEWIERYVGFSHSLLGGIAYAKFLVQNHPDISKEAKEKIENIQIYMQPCYSHSSVGICGRVGSPDSIAVQIYGSGCGGCCTFFSYRYQRVFVFGLLKEFAHVIYGNFDFLFQAQSEQERLEAFNRCKNFAFQNKRALYFAMELLCSKKAAREFFREEESSRYRLFDCKPNKMADRDLDRYLLKVNKIDVPCWRMKKKKECSVRLKIRQKRDLLIKDYGKIEKLIVSSGLIFKFPLKKSSPVWINVI